MEPLSLIENYSADVTRYWASTGSLGRDIIMSEDELKNGAKLVNKLYNAGTFIWLFLENYTPKQCELLPMDKWIIAKFNNMYANFIRYFDKYEIGLAMNELESFFWNFCDNYIEIAKNRLYKPEIYGEAAKQSAQFASYHVFLGMLKMFAIYLPHVTEELYQNTFISTVNEISVHKLQLATIDVDIDADIISKGDEVVDIVSKIRQFKTENKLSLKTQIESLDITSPNNEFISSVDYDIKAVGGIQKLTSTNGESNMTFGAIIPDAN